MKRLLFFIIAISILSSCVSRKPDAIYVSESDYNLRKSVHGAHFRKRVNIIGVLTMVGGTAAGAYLGYNTDLYDRQIGTRTEINQPANAVVGGLIGLSVTTLGNYIAGRNQTVSCKTPEKWLKKSNGGYVFLEGDNSQFRAIHKSAESKFVVRNYQDIVDFSTAFPSSAYTDHVVKLAAAPNVLSRDQTLQVINRYPTQPSSIMLKKAYVDRSSILSEYLAACERYPEAQTDMEATAAKRVQYASDIALFAQKFPNSKYAFELFERFKGVEESVSVWITSFPNHEKIETVKIHALTSFTYYDIDNLYEMNKVYQVLKLDDVYNSNYKSNLSVAKKINDRLLELEPKLGKDYVVRTTENLKNNWIGRNIPSSNDSSQKIKKFIDLLIENKWLLPTSNNYENRLKNDLATANKREEEERERDRLARLKAEEEKKANTLADLKKSIANNDMAGMTLYVTSNGYREEIESQLSFDEQIELAKRFDAESRREMLWNKLGYWKEYGPFLSLYPQYTATVESSAFANLQKRAEEGNWCYSCCEIYLRLFTNNAEKTKNVEAWRKFAHEHEIAQKNLEAARKFEAAAKTPTQSSSSSSSSSGPRMCSNCAGRGREVCSSCDGTGIRTAGWSDEKEVCDSCNGAGYKKCYSCNGRGTNR